jgi:DNA-binding CsgD family transcriptional regulator
MGRRVMKTVSGRQDQYLAETVRALGRPEFPATLAKFLRQCAAFDNFIILAYKAENNPVVIYREYSDSIVYQAMDSEYIPANYLLDPFYEAHLKGVSSGMHRLFNLAPDRFRQTSYFKVYYEKTTLIDEIAAFARTDTGITITACLGKDRSSGSMFTKGQYAALNRHAGVVTCLMEVNWRLLQLASAAPQAAAIPLIDRLRERLEEMKDIRLSRRQAEVALLILQGHSSNSIGLLLNISTFTVKVFRKQLYLKCNISSQAELFATILPLLSNSNDR